jgi:hypothetical protein
MMSQGLRRVIAIVVLCLIATEPLAFALDAGAARVTFDDAAIGTRSAL